jgi:hypothetical protein
LIGTRGRDTGRTVLAMNIHTRQAVIMRLISHDAYHWGELSQTFGTLKLPQIEMSAPKEALDAADEAYRAAG